MNAETYDAHIEYTCTRNKNFLSQYGKDDKFEELDMTILAGDFGWNFNKSRSNDTSKVNKKPVTQQAKTDIEKAKPLTPTLTRQRRSSKKQSTPKKTRSGRTIKIPQVDGNADSSGSEIDDKNHKIPQFDGQNDGQYSTDSGNAGQPQSNQSSYYIGDNQSFSGVIPILMPPGIIIIILFN